MKITIDPALTITITNTMCNYDWYQDKLVNYQTTVTKNRKNGYLTCDKTGKEIGIVFMSDDARSKNYGAAEILFFKKHMDKYGVSRVISLRDSQFKFLMFDKLQKILEKETSYTVTTASQVRT